MIRILFLALLVTFAAPALADDASVLEQMRTLCPERAKHTKRLEEMMGFEKIYDQRREKLANAAKMLKNETSLIKREQADVNEACKSRTFVSKREYQEANQRCKDLRKPYEERVEAYKQDAAKHREEVAKLLKDEEDRNRVANEAVQGLDAVEKQIGALAAQLTDPAKKACAEACNKGPAAKADACLQACINPPAPAPEAPK